MLKQISPIFLLTIIAISSYGQNEVKVFETKCDSIYKNKEYKIIQQHFQNGIAGNEEKNTIFSFIRIINSKEVLIFKDTIFSSTGEIEFRNFNNDRIKDILIQNTSDVRSNWTYYLYIVDTLHDRLKKIKGFEEIKAPNYLPKYDLIDNYVMSGQIWTSFYKIEGNHIKDFGIVIYDNQSDDGKYKRAYNKSLKQILARKQNNR